MEGRRGNGQSFILALLFPSSSPGPDRISASVEDVLVQTIDHNWRCVVWLTYLLTYFLIYLLTYLLKSLNSPRASRRRIV